MDRAWQGSPSITGLTDRVRRVPGGAKGFPAAKKGNLLVHTRTENNISLSCLALQLQWPTSTVVPFYDRASRTYDSTYTSLKPQEERLGNNTRTVDSTRTMFPSHTISMVGVST
jgi:hypothetical protein